MDGLFQKRRNREHSFIQHVLSLGAALMGITILALGCAKSTMTLEGDFGSADTTLSTVPAGPPTVTLSSSVGTTTKSTSIPVTITFNQSVTGFESDDITVEHGSATNFTKLDWKTYTVTITPDLNSTATVSVPKDVAFNASNEGNSAATPFSIQHDGIAPSVDSVDFGTPNAVYTTNAEIKIQVHFTEPVYVDTLLGIPTLTMANGGTGQPASYLSGSGTQTLTFNYVVKSGDSTDDLDYIDTSPLDLNGGTIKDAARNDAVLTLPAARAAGSLSADHAIIINTSIPYVSDVSFNVVGDYFNAGKKIEIWVSFSEEVKVDTSRGTPSLKLETGLTDHSAIYVSGSETSKLVFEYTVADGDHSAKLDYVDSSSLYLNNGTITDAAGNSVDSDSDGAIALAAPGQDGSLSHDRTIVIDTTSPLFSSLTFASNDGYYKAGSTIYIQVSFSEKVRVDLANGHPSITLAVNPTNVTALYDPGSESPNLLFKYVVQAGDSAADLDYVSASSLRLNSGIIQDLSGNTIPTDANGAIPLPTPGTAGSLAYARNIAINTDTPTVKSVTSTDSGPHSTGETITIKVNFSEPVVVTGTAPTLLLETGTTDRSATYSSGSGTSTLTFKYIVQTGDLTGHLNYASTNALTIPTGGAIRDLAENNADVTLPALNDLNSLAQNSNIDIDTNFNDAWNFDAGSEDFYSFNASKLEFVGGVCQVRKVDQTDNSGEEFAGANALVSGQSKGTVWDLNGYLRLGNTTDCNGTLTNCSELDGSWTPKWSNLSGYWPLDNSGSGGASSIPGKEGLNGVASNANGLGFAYGDGQINRSITFDGSDDSISVPNDGTWLGSNQFSVTAWVQPTNVTAQRVLLSAGNSGTSGFMLFLDSAGYWKFHVSSGGGGVYSGVQYPLAIMLSNSWTHVAATFAGGYAKLYLNGTLAVVASGKSYASPPTGNPFMIGALQEAGGPIYHFPGKIDDVAYWNVALADTDIRTLYDRQSAKYAGTFTSRIIDVGQLSLGSTSWSSLAWTSTLPFFKELPDAAGTNPHANSESSTDYSSLVGSTGQVGNNDLMSGIAGLWHLNETSGTTAFDDSGNGLNGTIVGTPNLGQPSRFGAAPLLNGTDGIDLGTPAALKVSRFTISSWFRAGYLRAGIRNVIFRWRTHGYVLYLDDVGALNVAITYATNTVPLVTAESLLTSPSTRNYADGYWHHVVGTYDGSALKIFVDGQKMAEKAETAAIYYPNTDVGSGAAIGKDGNSDSSNRFLGQLDEVAVWSRALNATEIAQLYRRGANRLKFQVRSCSDSTCSTQQWMGPGGTNQTYFSELNNNTVPLTQDGNVQKGPPNMSLSVPNNRYFQYRAILESDDEGNLCSYNSEAAPCAPELKSVSVGPDHYDASAPTVIAKKGSDYHTLQTFLENSSCTKGIKYNFGVNTDGSIPTTWWYYNSGTKQWLQATAGNTAQANTALEVTGEALGQFTSQRGTGTIYIKAYLLSDGEQSCALDSITLIGLR